MSKKIGLVLALAAVCALSLFLLSCGSSSSRPSGLLYVLTQGNNGVGNNITSFAIDLGNGNLSLINSNASTCQMGGACGSPVSIVLDPTGGVAFVLSQGAISSYKVNSDGSLGSPTSTSPWGNDVAVAMTRNAGGTFLYVITEAPQLFVFSTTPGSPNLTAVNNGGANGGFDLPRVPTGLSALTLTSPAEELLFVTSNHDLSLNHNDNTLSVYNVASGGTLLEKTGSPYTTSTINPLSVLAVNTNVAPQTSGGMFIYVGAAGNATGALDAFQLCTAVNATTCTQTDVNNAKLLSIGTPTSSGQLPVGMVVDPTNNFLYVVAEQSNQLFGFKIVPAGTLSPLAPASLPTGTTPVALAMHSTGKFLYTSNTNANNISAFTLSTTTGSMATAATVNSPSVPSGMTAR